MIPIGLLQLWQKTAQPEKILFDEFFEFVTPDYTIAEIEEHRDELKKKLNLIDEEFEILLSLLFERITVIPEAEYKQFIDECKNNISDRDDVPHLAASLAIKAEGIWAHDPHFKEQHKVKVFTNVDMLRMNGKSNL